MSTKKHYGLKEMERDFGPLTFGNMLSSHRLCEEISQVNMAKSLGISKQSLNDLEKGRVFPSIGRAVEIAKKLGFFVELTLQVLIEDQLRREKLHFAVKIERAKRRPRRAS